MSKDMQKIIDASGLTAEEFKKAYNTAKAEYDKMVAEKTTAAKTPASSQT